MEQLRRKHQFSELNSAGWEDRSGSPWPRKGGAPTDSCLGCTLCTGHPADGEWGLTSSLPLALPSLPPLKL